MSPTISLVHVFIFSLMAFSRNWTIAHRNLRMIKYKILNNIYRLNLIPDSKFNAIRSFRKDLFRYHFYSLFWVPLSSTQTSSVQHISFTRQPHLFSPQNPSVPHKKPLNFTHSSVPHHKPLSLTQKKLTKIALYKLRGVLNWRVFGVELRGG